VHELFKDSKKFQIGGREISKDERDRLSGNINGIVREANSRIRKVLTFFQFILSNLFSF